MRWLALGGCVGLLSVACSETSDNPFGSGGAAANTTSGGAGVSSTDPNATAGAASGAAGSGSATGGAGSVVVNTTPGFYATNPPKQCGNQTWAAGCQDGVATTTCGGKCTSSNACREGMSKTSTDSVTFACSRYMLFAPEMMQAAIDDGLPGFNYAVAGHDIDAGGLDPVGATSTCCQCYQIVFDNGSENQINVDPNTVGSPSALTVPPPLVVQSFNTSTNNSADFDIYMAAGGFGANNACDPTYTNMPSGSGLYTYTAFPDDGETTQGGVKAVSLYSECKTSTSWVTPESLGSAACQSKVAQVCEQIVASDATLTATTVNSCKKSNSTDTPYHLNWNIYIKKVECPQHLAEVTGCKLAPQGLPAVDPNVTTPAQAALDSSFKTHAADGVTRFHTTTMQDCCKPTCAWQDFVTGTDGGLTAQGLYNSFYSCDASDKPITE